MNNEDKIDQTSAAGAASELTDVLERICIEVMAEYGMSFGGVYIDFANEVARRAVLLEREACAKVCESEEVNAYNNTCPNAVPGYWPDQVAHRCAVAIRARSNSGIYGSRKVTD